MGDVAKLVPPIRKVRLRKLTTTDGSAHVGVELEYRSVSVEPTRIEFGLDPEDAVRLGSELTTLGEKLRSTEY